MFRTRLLRDLNTEEAETPQYHAALAHRRAQACISVRRNVAVTWRRLLNSAF
jgi:hypothetical protein